MKIKKNPMICIVRVLSMATVIAALDMLKS